MAEAEASPVEEEVHPWADFSPEQREALAVLGSHIEGFASAFAQLSSLGVRPAEALRACGIGVPAMAAPMLDKLLADAIARAGSD